VLFSEPKIPQSLAQYEEDAATLSGFSALQRAENSSIDGVTLATNGVMRFSALQRAENSSISPICVITPERA